MNTNMDDILRKHNIAPYSDLSNEFIATKVWAVYVELNGLRHRHWLATKEWLPNPTHDIARVFGKTPEWMDEYLHRAMDLALPGWVKQEEAEYQ